MTTKIQLKINCDEKMCGNCQFKKIHYTGMIGEFHPKCIIFNKCGKWGEMDMIRDRKCINAQNNMKQNIDIWNKHKDLLEIHKKIIKIEQLTYELTECERHKQILIQQLLESKSEK